MLNRWPWFTILVALLLALNLVGLDIIYSALFSDEALSRNIGGPIVAAAVVAIVAVGIAEWGIRRMLANRAFSGEVDTGSP